MYCAIRTHVAFALPDTDASSNVIRYQCCTPINTSHERRARNRQPGALCPNVLCPEGQRGNMQTSSRLPPPPPSTQSLVCNVRTKKHIVNEPQRNLLVVAVWHPVDLHSGCTITVYIVAQRNMMEKCATLCALCDSIAVIEWM